MEDRGATEESLAALAYIAYHARLRRQGRMVGDAYMARHAHLARQYAVSAYLGRAGDSRLRLLLAFPLTVRHLRRRFNNKFHQQKNQGAQARIIFSGWAGERKKRRKDC